MVNRTVRNNALYNLFLRLRSLCDRLVVIFKFKKLFGSNRKRKTVASRVKLSFEEEKDIKSLWAGIKIKDYWFKWYKYKDQLESQQGLDRRILTVAPTHISHYIPDDLYFMFFCSYFSNIEACAALDDKNLYDLYFPGIKMPETLFRRINGCLLHKYYSPIKEDKALEIIRGEETVVMKESVDSSGGKGVCFINRIDDDSVILKALCESENYIVQKVIRQHKVLSSIHSSSINTIRIVTLYFQGEVRVLSGIVRMGIGESRVDNSSSGGIFCGITEDGHMKKYAYNKWLNCYSTHPTSGFVFDGTIVPGYDEAKGLCKDLHLRFIQLSRLISWDLAIDLDGTPVLIEPNFACGDIDFHQIANGPLFGDFTEIVIHDVFGNKVNRKLNRLFY